MSSALLDRLHRLCSIWGPAGREQRVAEELAELIRPFVDEVRKDPFGNLLAIKRGAPGARRVMLAAHMDTIGATAVHFGSQGLIRLVPVGEFKAHHAIGQRVVWGSGVVGVLQHEPISDPKEIEMKGLWCDIGATSEAELVESLHLGDMCTLVGELQQMGDAIAGPGLDNRAGCAVLLEVAEHLGESEHEVVFAFTCQGETGPRGAGVAAFGAEPDLAFAVDLSAAGDVPKGPKVDLKLGRGPALKLKDGAYMANHALSSLVQQVAEANAIPLQMEIVHSPGGHNDAQAIAVTGQGVPTAVIGIPARYRRTGQEMVNQRDLYGAADLLLKLLQSPLT